MTDRKLTLIKVLNEIFTLKEIEKFFKYELKINDIEFLKSTIKDVLSIVSYDAYNCANLSSLLGVSITDNSNIPIVIMTGHLDYNGNRLFNCDKPISVKANNSKVQDWNGHCWIECGKYILDVSIFRTVYFGENFPEKIKKHIVSRYGEGKGAIMIPKDSINEYGFEYTPRFALDDEQIINGLVKGIKLI